MNGKLTLGEDIADLGGLILAYRAWAPKHASDPPRDGLTPPQRFFVGYAQWACANVRPETARLRARTDPHSPPRYRINGVLVNMPEFAQAFAFKAGQPRRVGRRQRNVGESERYASWTPTRRSSGRARGLRGGAGAASVSEGLSGGIGRPDRS